MNRNIYLLLNGKLAKDKLFANEVLVMDWEGNLKRKYILDRTVKTISVDEKGGTLICNYYGLEFGVYYRKFVFPVENNRKC